MKTYAGSVYKMIGADAILCVVVAVLPALAHVAPFRISIFDPMRIMLFVGVIFVFHFWNSIFLATIIPLVSFVLTGHPPFFKSLLISIELCANVYLFFYFSQSLKMNRLVSFSLSIIASKVVYYSLKLGFLKAHLLEGQLIGLDLSMQLLALAINCICFELLVRVSQR